MIMHQKDPQCKVTRSDMDDDGSEHSLDPLDLAELPPPKSPTPAVGGGSKKKFRLSFNASFNRSGATKLKDDKPAGRSSSFHSSASKLNPFRSSLKTPKKELRSISASPKKDRLPKLSLEEPSEDDWLSHAVLKHRKTEIKEKKSSSLTQSNNPLFQQMKKKGARKPNYSC